MTVSSMLAQICAAGAIVCAVGALIMYAMGNVSDTSGAKGNAGLIGMVIASLAFTAAAAGAGTITI